MSRLKTVRLISSEHLFIETVPAEIAVSAQSHEVKLLQHPEMMRDGRFFQLEDRRELLDAMLGGGEQANYLEAGCSSAIALQN